MTQTAEMSDPWMLTESTERYVVEYDANPSYDGSRVEISKSVWTRKRTPRTDLRDYRDQIVASEVVAVLDRSSAVALIGHLAGSLA